MDGSEEQVCVGNGCLKCVTKVVPQFPYCFEELVELIAEDAELRSSVDMVVAAQTSGDGSSFSDLPAPVGSVVTNTEFLVQVDRPYIFITEKELCNITGRTRLPKQPMETVPMVLLPKEDDPANSEWHYALKASDERFRRGTVSSVMRIAASDYALPTVEQTWPGQRLAFERKALEGTRLEHGFEELAKKPFHQLPTLDDLKARLLKGCQIEESAPAPAESERRSNTPRAATPAARIQRSSVPLSSPAPKSAMRRSPSPSPSSSVDAGDVFLSRLDAFDDPVTPVPAAGMLSRSAPSMSSDAASAAGDAALGGSSSASSWPKDSVLLQSDLSGGD